MHEIVLEVHKVLGLTTCYQKVRLCMQNMQQEVQNMIRVFLMMTPYNHILDRNVQNTQQNVQYMQHEVQECKT